MDIIAIPVMERRKLQKKVGNSIIMLINTCLVYNYIIYSKRGDDIGENQKVT